MPYFVILSGAILSAHRACSAILMRWMPKQGKDGADEKAWGTTMLDLGVTVGSMVVLPVRSIL